MYQRKDLLGMKDLRADEINAVLSHAVDMKKIAKTVKKSDTLRGKSVFLAFYENSTRTQSSFDHATKILGGNSVNLSVGSSSVKKGEVLLDTASTLAQLEADVIVMRHSSSGAAAFVADNLAKTSIVNAGDGCNEHPTQCLLDLFTMQSKFGQNLSGLEVLIVGDIKHSRVARSNIWALRTLNCRVSVCCPPTLAPSGLEHFGVKIVHSIEDVLPTVDVCMLLRMQQERQSSGIITGLDEYTQYYQLTKKRVSLMKSDSIIMHPGPVNRGIEIDSYSADCEKSVIDEQVSSGLYVRMAILDILGNNRK